MGPLGSRISTERALNGFVIEFRFPPQRGIPLDSQKTLKFSSPWGPPGGPPGGKPKIDHETSIGLANGAEILHAPRYNLETRIPSSTAPGAQGNTVL